MGLAMTISYQNSESHTYGMHNSQYIDNFDFSTVICLIGTNKCLYGWKYIFSW